MPWSPLVIHTNPPKFVGESLLVIAKSFVKYEEGFLDHHELFVGIRNDHPVFSQISQEGIWAFSLVVPVAIEYFKAKFLGH